MWWTCPTSWDGVGSLGGGTGLARGGSNGAYGPCMLQEELVGRGSAAVGKGGSWRRVPALAGSIAPWCSTYVDQYANARYPVHTVGRPGEVAQTGSPDGERRRLDRVSLVVGRNSALENGLRRRCGSFDWPARQTVCRAAGSGKQLQAHEGEICNDALIGEAYGRRVWIHLGKSFLVLEPSVHDLVLLNIKRKGQIIYPKDAGYLLLKMNIHSGCRVIEAGTGSGGLTLVLARAVAPEGRVFSYEAREEMQENAARNLRKLEICKNGLSSRRVILPLVLTRRMWMPYFWTCVIPGLYLEQCCAALVNGGFFGALVPTTNQVSDLITALQLGDFGDIRAEELLLRQYKPVPQRLRPMDTMIGHTGFLVFARKIMPYAITTEQDHASHALLLGDASDDDLSDVSVLR